MGHGHPRFGIRRDLPGQAAEHDADHGEANEGGDGSGVALEVAGETPVGDSLWDLP
jgi:hypothetical protein